MRIHYDVKGDVLYIEFKKGTVTTKRIDEDVAIDYDEKGWVAGIEVLSAKERVLGKKERVSVTTQPPDIDF
ncbi:MAG: DUF2283 domain-containing protein [bacterium]|nr:DUF2283 domain-containing protein [bacterium]